MAPITLFENFTVYSPRKYFSQNLFFAKWSKVSPSKCWVFITGHNFQCFTLSESYEYVLEVFLNVPLNKENKIYLYSNSFQ